MRQDTNSGAATVWSLDDNVPLTVREAPSVCTLIFTSTVSPLHVVLALLGCRVHGAPSPKAGTSLPIVSRSRLRGDPETSTQHLHPPRTRPAYTLDTYRNSYDGPVRRPWSPHRVLGGLVRQSEQHTTRTTWGGVMGVGVLLLLLWVGHLDNGARPAPSRTTHPTPRPDQSLLADGGTTRSTKLEQSCNNRFSLS